MKVFANGQWCDVRKSVILPGGRGNRESVPALTLQRRDGPRLKRKLRYWFMLSVNKIV